MTIDSESIRDDVEALAADLDLPVRIVALHLGELVQCGVVEPARGDAAALTAELLRIGGEPVPPGMRLNVATASGRRLGGLLDRFYLNELGDKPDRRCSTCAFRHGRHIANGSPEPLMSALKSVLEGTVFDCHQRAGACVGWAVLRLARDQRFAAPWPHQDGI